MIFHSGERARSSRECASSGWTWIIALAMHVAVPIGAEFVPAPALLAFSSSTRAAVHLFEVEVADLPAMRGAGAQAPGRPGEAEARVDVGVASRPARRAAVLPALGATVTAEGAARPRPATPSLTRDDEYGGPADATPIGSRFLPGGPVWAVPGAVVQPAAPAPAPTVAGPSRRVDRDVAGRVLRDTQRARDKAIGIDLPAAGTVASVVVAAVYGADTPAFGRATFAVRLGPKGEILGVRLATSSGGARAAWERALAAIAAQLAERQLAMTGAFASGATVYVDVESVVQLPEGESTRGGPPVASADRGVSFSLSNIGAHGSRVVKSRFRVAPAG